MRHPIARLTQLLRLAGWARPTIMPLGFGNQVVRYQPAEAKPQKRIQVT